MPPVRSLSAAAGNFELATLQPMVRSIDIQKSLVRGAHWATASCGVVQDFSGKLYIEMSAQISGYR